MSCIARCRMSWLSYATYYLLEFSFWTLWLFGNVLFNSHIFVRFPNIFWWFLNLFHCGQRTCFVLFIPSNCIEVVVELSMWLAWRLSCEKVGWSTLGCLLGMLADRAVYVSCCLVDVLPSSLSIKCRYQCLQLLFLNCPLCLQLSVFLHVLWCSLIRYALSF